MLCGGDLGEGLRLGTVGLVATGADDGGIELGRFHGGRVVSMPGLGSVASFAGDDDVLALLLLVYNVGMAGLAGVMAGEGDRPRRCLGDGSAAIVAVLAEAARDDGGAQEKECDHCDRHDGGEPDEVFDVLEQVAFLRRDAGAMCAGKGAMILDNWDLRGER